MKRFNGGSKVPGGYYVNPSQWEIAAISGEQGVLEGEPTSTWYRAPLPVIVVLALVLGGLMVVFLPVIGFALLAWALMRKGAAPVVAASQQLVRSARPHDQKNC